MRAIVQYALTKFLMTLIAVLVITGCLPSSGGAPQGAQDAAFHFMETTCPTLGECADYSVDSANKLEISGADKRNGISAIYTLRISYSMRFGQKEEWVGWSGCVWVVNKSGTWIASPSNVGC